MISSILHVLIILSVLVSVHSFNTNPLVRKLVSTKPPQIKIDNLRKINTAFSSKKNRSPLKKNWLLSSIESYHQNHEVQLCAHSKLVHGKLLNGLSYVLLPNDNPSGRFEAHLEILTGSSDELEHQQGMAHLLEHVAYMGSAKRQLISGTGSRTNAYTDFHHTVFFAGCPTVTPDQFWKKPMLPMALDALVDVMSCSVDKERLEKERAAVLSEASMVNKIDYRVECQILGALHSENRISKRFPIGKENLIRNWNKVDVQAFHDTHYRPDNAVLYLVGDFDPSLAAQVIEQKFGHLTAKNDHSSIKRLSGEFPPHSMHEVNRHFPHVIHTWSSPASLADLLLPVTLGSRSLSALQSGVDAIATASNAHSAMPIPTVFTHELLQSFSFHLFAKRPIEPVATEQALTRELLRRIALTALQIRLNVQQRQHPLFTSIDFNQANWPREGCAVCSLDLTTDVSTWRQAVITAITEVRRLGLFGLTASELTRFKQSLLTETAQVSAQFDQLSSEDLTQELMDHEAAGHTYMHPLVKLETVTRLVDKLTLEQVNAMATELCEHLSHPRLEDGVRPVAIVACAPLMDRAGSLCPVTEQDVSLAVEEALSTPLEPLIETIIPDSLIPTDLLVSKLTLHPPMFVSLDEKAMSESKQTSEALGVVQRKLSNGIKVNMKSQSGESQRARLRLYVPGGRMKESDTLTGAVELGVRTIQEGGAFLNLTREQVELFCIDHNVLVEVQCTPSALVFDFSSVTTSGPGETVTGIEAAMQVAHVLLTDFKYEEDAFQRAKQALHEQFDSTRKGLESACLESLTHSLTQGDKKYLDPNHQQLDHLTLSTAKVAVVAQMAPDNVEVSLCGDLSLSDMEALSLAYLGTVSSRVTSPLTSQSDGTNEETLSPSVDVQVLGETQQLGVYLTDSDERAMGYLAGRAPDAWGVFPDGQTLGDRLRSVKSNKKQNNDKSHRDHRGFGQAVLMVLEEVANRRLFSVVREERRLTYDASFQIESHEAIRGGWFLVSVTSNPSEVQTALMACREAMQSLIGQGSSEESVEAAKHTLLNKRHTDLSTNKFWVESLTGTQLTSLPNKTLQSLVDFENVVNSITVQDVRDVAGLFSFNEKDTTACVGVTAPQPPEGM